MAEKLVGSKIKESDECPIDIFFIRLCELVSPYIKKYGIIPNQITLLSLIAGLSVSYALYKNKNIIAFFLWVFSYFLDCLDGYCARKYDMETKFGDYFDHFSDLVKSFAIILVILHKMNKKYRIKYLILLTLLGVLMLSHVGCQEIITDNEGSHSLNVLKSLCISPKICKTLWLRDFFNVYSIKYLIG